MRGSFYVTVYYGDHRKLKLCRINPTLYTLSEGGRRSVFSSLEEAQRALGCGALRDLLLLAQTGGLDVVVEIRTKRGVVWRRAYTDKPLKALGLFKEP